MGLTHRIIPCLDLKDGRVVKGINFENVKDAGDPVELARRYNDQGADEVVFLDITASKDHCNTMIDVIRRAADNLFLPLTVGGGIKTTSDIHEILRAGADKVSINTSAVLNKEIIRESAQLFGNQCIVLAEDVKRNYNMRDGVTPIYLKDGSTCWYEVVIYGGSHPTGIDAIQWAQEAVELGAGEVLLTSIETDGMNTGYDLEITSKVSESLDVPLIASGGVGTYDHFYDGFVKGKADACLAAGVFHSGKMTVKSVKKYLLSRGITVRV